MAITNDAVIAQLAARREAIMKASATSEGAGTWHSLWKLAGNPAAGANPPVSTAGSGYIPTKATLGSIPWGNNAGAGNNTHLAQLMASLTVAGTLIIYDRLWACSGFVTNSTAAQNITTPGTINRGDTNGGDVEIWGEVYTAPGATGATWTVSYTDQDNNAAQSATYTHPANAETVGQMFPFVLAAGDSGVRAVASLTCSVSSGTAGDIGITLLRRLAEIPIAVGTGLPGSSALDAYQLGLPVIEDDACLAMMIQCSATTTGVLLGHISVAELTP